MKAIEIKVGDKVRDIHPLSKHYGKEMIVRKIIPSNNSMVVDIKGGFTTYVKRDNVTKVEDVKKEWTSWNTINMEQLSERMQKTTKKHAVGDYVVFQKSEHRNRIYKIVSRSCDDEVYLNELDKSGLIHAHDAYLKKVNMRFEIGDVVKYVGEDKNYEEASGTIHSYVRVFDNVSADGGYFIHNDDEHLKWFFADKDLELKHEEIVDEDDDTNFEVTSVEETHDRYTFTVEFTFMKKLSLEDKIIRIYENLENVSEETVDRIYLELENM